MKKILPLLVLGAVAASTSAQADSGWYIGTDVHQINADFESDLDLDLSSSTGFGIALGKEIALSQQFVLAFEGEFIHYGSFKKNASILDPYGNAYGYSVELKGYAMNINAKPKYYIPGSAFYLGAVAGFGVMGVELKIDAPVAGFANSYSDDGRDIGFNYGAEAGYEFASGLIVSGGYRASSVTIDVESGGDVDFDFDGFYLGLDYKF
ncbi:outer membrane beta-barrel protein [Vibrio harveyi]